MSDPFSPLPTEVFGADLSALQPEAIREFAMAQRLANLAYEQGRREYREENPHVSREVLADVGTRLIGHRFSHCAACDLNPDVVTKHDPEAGCPAMLKVEVCGAIWVPVYV